MAKRSDVPKVYLVTFPNGKQYVGITTATMEVRKSEHKSRARHGRSFAIHAALNKYVNQEIWEVLKICDSYEEAKELEKKYIKDLKTMSPNGYNLTQGGDGIKGKVFTDEQRKRLSEAHKGYVMPQSVVDKIANSNRGKRRSDEAKARMSSAQKGKKLSAQHIESIIKSACKEFEIYDKNTKAFIGKWLVIAQCAKDLNISRTALQNHLTGWSKSVGGYVAKRIG